MVYNNKDNLICDLDKKYTEYAEDILNGKIVACEYIKLACKRYLDCFQRSDMYFDADKADKPIRFISKLSLYSGEFAGKKIELMNWQRWLIYAIYGFYWREDNTRVIRNVYLEIARKNSKSTTAAALCLYAMIADGEASSECELLANSAKQAGIAFSMCSNLIQSLDPKGKLIKQYRDQLRFPATKSFLQVLSTDSTSNDGWNSHFFLVDEYHSSPDSKMYDVMKTSQGFRLNPMAVVITTAGLSLDVPCYQMRQTNIEILKGIKEDDSTFAAIYTLDDDDNFEDESIWIKANPSLDITVKRKYLREMVTQAKNNPSTLTSTLTKNFNIWCRTVDVWIPDNKILDITEDIDLNKFQGMQCYMSFDLASVSDLTALSVMIPCENKLYFKTWYFLPLDTIENSPNRENYKKWVQQGKLIATQGNVTDYDYILNKIMEINKILVINKISYDSWNSTAFVIKCVEQGLPMQPYSQSLGSFNKPTKEFERLVLQKNVVIDNNIITRWCIQNAVIKQDWNDNVKPIKGSDYSQKIDGVISILMCLGGYLENNIYNNELFTL